MQEAIKTLQDWIDNTGNIVCYSGLSTSLESGVLDYRRMEADHFEHYKHPAEMILSRPYFERKPDLFFKYYREKVLAPLLTAEPTATHHTLAALERADKLRMLITSNFDELHKEAGSKRLIELNGSVMRNNCPRCERFLSALDVYERPELTKCDVDMCGGIITPEILLYGDAINPEVLANAIYFALTANIFIVAGASLQEYPTAAIVHYYEGKKLVLIGEEESALDARANLVIRAPVHAVFAQLVVNPAK